MAPTYKNVHNRFKLNGLSFSREELKEVGYSLVKEGEDYEKSIGDFLLDWLSDIPTLQVKTSGSTGTPKLITLQKQLMVNSAMATGDFFKTSVGNSALLCLPCDYIAGKMMLVRAMILGWALDYVQPTSQPLATTSKTYDFAAMVPMQLSASLDKMEQIKTLIVGGAPITHGLREMIKDIRTNVYETYGMTETVTHVAAKKLTTGLGPSPGPIQSSFKALPNITFSKDQRGCLVINAPHLNIEKVETNDIVDLCSDTEFQWLGRYDHIVNSGAIKLIPEQIETKLSPILDTRFFTIGMEDPDLGNKLVLIVEGENDEEAILKKIHSSSVLEKYEIPKRVYTLDRFSETANGKVLRHKNLERVLLDHHKD